MIEIFSIIFQLLLFIIIFSFPVNLFNKNLLFENHYLGISDCYCLNIIIHLNLLLICSFLNIDQRLYFYILIVLSLFFNVFFIKKYLDYILSKKKILVNFTFFILITIALFGDLASHLKLEWDALSHWVWKTTNFYENMGIENIKNLRFPYYPHLGPYVWSFFWKNSILEYEYFGRLFYVFLYIVSIFSIVNYFFRNSNLSKFIIIFFIIILSFDRFLFSGYQGYLLFSILIIVSRFSFFLNKNFRYLLILIIIGHPLMWIKDEGLFYYFIFIFPFILMSPIDLRKKMFVLMLALMLPIIQYYLQKYYMGIFGFQAEIINDSLKQNLNLKILFSKIFLISKFMIVSIIKYKLWIINLLSFTIMFFFFKKININLKIFYVIAFINLSFLFAVYIHTPYDLKFLLTVTLDRLVFHSSGFYLPIVLILLKKLLNTSYNSRSKT